MKKRVFYTEVSYVLALLLLALGAALTELANLGMSMVVAPAYILHLQLSQFLPWFTFGVAEYAVQGLLILLVSVIMRGFKLSYLFSFVTALLYGTVLDGAICAVSLLPDEMIAWRILWFVAGTVLCAIAVSLFFHTYISPGAYELIVKEIARRFSMKAHKVKTGYDCLSTAVAILLSFAFFGFGVFRGVGIGTVICALLNGFLIGKITATLEKIFVFKNRFPLERYFQ